MLVGERPAGYTMTQIVLHWLIAALVIFQLIVGEDIKPAYRALRKGVAAAPDDLFAADLHLYVGVAVLGLACLRIVFRYSYGAPAAPPEETAMQRWAAAAIHALLYVAILVMPLTGLAAWYLGLDALGEVHEIGKPVMIIAIALHIVGALWQHFIAKTDVLVRMLKPAGGGAARQRQGRPGRSPG